MLKKVKNWDSDTMSTNDGEAKLPQVDQNGNIIDPVESEFDKLASITDLVNEKGENLEAMDDKYSHLLSAYQMTGSAKVKGTVEFLENKVKFIVFCHHYDMMD